MKIGIQRLSFLLMILGLAVWPAGSSANGRPQERSVSITPPNQAFPERPFQQLRARPLAETRGNSALGTVNSPTWAKSYGGFLASRSTLTENDRPRRVVEAFDGNLIVAGSAALEASGSGNSKMAILVVKLNRTGEVQWRGVFPADPSKTYAYYATNLVATRDGGCLIVGTKVEGWSTETPLVMKLGPDGTVEWQ